MKRMVQTLIMIMILWYTCVKYVEFKRDSLFNVRKINIDVKNKKLVKDLYESIEKIEGKNILLINKKKMEKDFLKDVRIKNVTIEKEMPDTLNFIIKEKKPFAYVEYQNKIYITDENGIIYGYMDESNNFNMPLFRVKKKENIINFVDIIKKIPYSEEVSQMYEIPNGIVITVNSGLKIITNLNVEEEKYKVVEKLYNKVNSELSKRNKIEYIDLRFNDYIIKKSRG